MRRMLIAIIDNKAKDITPHNLIWVHKNTATAVRMYTDVANDPKSTIAQHLEDYDLVQLGTIDDEHKITPTYEIIVLGKTYAAQLQEPTSDNTVRPIGAAR